MCQCLRSRKPLPWILSQQTLNEVLAFVAYSAPSFLRKLKSSFPYGIENDWVRVTVERWIATYQNVCNHSNRPNITRAIIFAFDKFGTHVVRRTNRICHWGVPLGILPSKAKINQTDIRIFIFSFKENVLGFNITMTNIFSAQVSDGFKERFDNASSLLLGKTSIRSCCSDDFIKQLSTGVLLSYYVYIFLVFIAVDHLHYAIVLHLGKNIDLSTKVVESGNLGFINRFDGK
mmetsp:Transcript_16061/g.33708  ORF Transcript_16061/g.33708 Transcript_16061/m.33708 type:complete len:232 (+) Transcript_16061:88-783(+)